MHNLKHFILVTSMIAAPIVQANSTALDDLLTQYQGTNGTSFDEEKGKSLWDKKYFDPLTGHARSCATCHTNNLRNEGKHAKTNKLIEPLAPSINKERLTKTKTIKKWLKRNCKWTLGRECTADEKGHFLTFIQSQ